MAFREILVPWGMQPQEAVRPAARWLNRGLCHLIINGQCIVSGQRLVYNGTKEAVDTVGVGVQATAGTNIAAKLPQSRLLMAAAGLGDYVIGVYASVPTNATRGFLICIGDSGGEAQEPYLLANCTGALVSTSGTVGGSRSGVDAVNISGGVDGTAKLFSFSRISGGHRTQAGKVFATGTGNAAAVYRSGGSMTVGVGGYTVSSSYGLTYASIPIGFCFEQGLSDEEMLSLNDNPWQLFEDRIIRVPVSAAATVPTLSASTYVPGSLSSTGWRPQITAS